MRLGFTTTEDFVDVDHTNLVQFPPGTTLTGVTGLAAGNGYSCALLNGGVLCWGDRSVVGRTVASGPAPPGYVVDSAGNRLQGATPAARTRRRTC